MAVLSDVATAILLLECLVHSFCRFGLGSYGFSIGGAEAGGEFARKGKESGKDGAS